MTDENAVDTEREMREHEREAQERDPAERTQDQGDPGAEKANPTDPENIAEDEEKPAPPAAIPGTTGQP
jgi:hypothetical protein